MARKLEVEIVGDASRLNKAYGDASDKTRKLGGAFGGLAKAAVIAGGAAGIGAVVVGLKSSISAAQEAEKAEFRLTQAFDSAKVSAKQRAQAMEAVNATSRRAALDDEDLSDVLAKLTRSTGNVKQATEGMALAADIARGRNISLEQAAKTVERAYLGNETALKRLGVVIPETTENLSKQERAQLAIAAAQEKFSGAAEQYGRTSAGAAETVGVAFENLQESIGQKILPVVGKAAQALSEVLPKAMDALGQAWERVQPHVNRVLAVMRDAWPDVKQIIQGFVDFFELHFLPIWDELVRIAGSAVARVVDVFRNNEPQIKQIVEGIKNILRGIAFVLREVVLPIVEKLFEEVLPRVIDVAINALALILNPIDTMKRAFETATLFIRDKFSDLWTWLRTTALDVALDVVEPFSHLPGQMGGWARRAKEAIQDQLDKINAEKAIENVNRAMRNWDVTEAGNAGARAGDAWRKKFLGSATPALDALTGGGKTGDGAIGDWGMGMVARAKVPTRATPGAPFGGQGLAPAVLDELALGQAMGLVLTSGRRAPRFPGDRSHHIVGHAIDMAGSAAQMAAFARAVAGRPGIVELLYDPIGFRSPGNDHYDHVHVAAYDSGGWLMPGLTLAENLTGRPEQVVPPGGGGFGVIENHITVELDGKQIWSSVRREDQRSRDAGNRGIGQ